MTLTKFKSLSTDHRYIVWLTKAVRIAEYKNLFYIYTLYQVEGFYVQVRTLRFFRGKEKWTAFANEIYLKPYLKKINLTELRHYTLLREQGIMVDPDKKK